MDLMSLLFVGNPLNILAVAAIFVLVSIGLRFSHLGLERGHSSLLVVAVAWACYAVWEWLILVRTPEANIRVDLLVIWPILIIITIWFSVRSFRRVSSGTVDFSEKQ